MTSNDLNHRESPTRDFCQNSQLGAFARIPNSGIFVDDPNSGLLPTIPTRDFCPGPQHGTFARFTNPGRVTNFGARGRLVVTQTVERNGPTGPPSMGVQQRARC